MEQHRPSVAVVGSGVAGLTAAHVCAHNARVTLYEAAGRLGGHADTHLVREGQRTLAIDTGFIVHNRRTYPTLVRLFDELGVATQDSEMSMSIRDDLTGVEWAGARGLGGLLPSWGRASSPAHLRMLGEVPRFHRLARRLLDTPGGDLTTLGEFLREGRFSAYFVRHFAEPLVAAVWSCDPTRAGDYPARYLFEFLRHHGMLSVFGSPTWRTVTGGSHEYVDRLAARLDEVRTGTPVTAIRERPDGVSVTDGSGETRVFDHVVVAVHPHQALALLPEATPAYKEILGAIRYSENLAVLHTDTSLLPKTSRARASWNFRRVRDGEGPVTMTYDLTRLQRLDTDIRYLVTLGGADLVDPTTVLDTMAYEHPLYDPESVAAQGRLSELDTDRVAFAGAYHGWGFHEDGARAGVAAARRLGFAWPDRPTRSPQVYATQVTHVRRRPWRRSFTHASSLWVVDIDHLPHPRGPLGRLRRAILGSIEARDHLGDPGATIRDNLARFLALHDLDLGDADVRLAAHPRALGHCFNPISVFWCTRRDGSPLATVVEVHNTYGDRHAYLLHPDAGGRGEVAKQMYVSPFHGTDGWYRITAPEPGERLDLAVALHTDDGAVFSASLRGRRVEGHRLVAVLAGPIDAARIRAHGIRLWARGLPVRPRPAHHQEGVR